MNGTKTPAHVSLRLLIVFVFQLSHALFFFLNSCLLKVQRRKKQHDLACPWHTVFPLRGLAQCPDGCCLRATTVWVDLHLGSRENWDNSPVIFYVRLCTCVHVCVFNQVCYITVVRILSLPNSHFSVELFLYHSPKSNEQ